MTHRDFSIEAPIILLRNIPDSERETAKAIQDSLGNLSKYVSSFGSALSLFDHCNDIAADARRGGPAQSELRAWRIIAAKEGAMTIYHIREAMSVITTLVKKTSYIARSIDTKELEKAKDAFKDAFPFGKRIRNAIAHGRMYT